MHEVEVKALPLELLASVLTPERARRSAESATRARAAFGDRTIWHVNATAHGGGVAEMLQTLLAYGRGAGIDNRWLVLDGEPEFFTITKRLHNLLHGDPGDGGRLGASEHACYERVVGTNVAAMLRLIDSRDFVLLHDPQTAGMVDGLRANGVRVVWRCHVGCDTRNDETDEAWAFLRPYIETRRRVRVLAPGVRADLGGSGAGPHHPAVDRSVLGQEPCPRLIDGRWRSWRPSGWSPERIPTAQSTSNGATARRARSGTTRA